MPEPQPISWGSISQGMPLFSTKTMPVRAARLSMRGLPPSGFLGGSSGRSGLMVCQSSSLTSCLVMLLAYPDTAVLKGSLRSQVALTGGTGGKSCPDDHSSSGASERYSSSRKSSTKDIRPTKYTSPSVSPHRLEKGAAPTPPRPHARIGFEARTIGG